MFIKTKNIILIDAFCTHHICLKIIEINAILWHER